jgi:Ca2+-transporting ATPase
LEVESVSRVTPVHAVVPGRARLRVAGLRGSAPLQRLLEAALSDAVEIRKVSASTITGTLLAHFDERLSLAAVIARVERILRESAPEAMPTRPSTETAWHAVPAAKVMAALRTSREGLSTEAARRRLSEHGRNALAEVAARSTADVLARQFQSLPVLLLAGAAALSLATGGVLDAMVILGVVGLNAAIGFATESKTDRILGSLGLPAQAAVPVLRDGTVAAVATEEIVPGDVMVLRPGTIIAADGRVLSAEALCVDESMLTGESLPVLKTEKPAARDGALAERSSMVYRGSTVVGGSGLAAAVATGRRTEQGRIQLLVGTARAPETPMQRQLATLGRQLVGLSVAVCGVVFVIGLVRGRGFLQMLKSSIALAVAAIPEGLPTVATTALALGIEDMRRHQVLVRRLDAIETLAAVNVIGFDKTGTLTENHMTATAIACGGRRLSVADGALRCDDRLLGAPEAGSDLARLLEVAVLCNEGAVDTIEGELSITGTPTEAALIRLAVDAGIDAGALRRRFPICAIEHRGEDRQYMITTHATGDGYLLAIKGNPEQVLTLCDRYQRDGKRLRLGRGSRRAILRENRDMAERRLRVLGLAYVETTARKPGNGLASAGAGEAQRGVWLGLVGLTDPARQSAAELLPRFDRAGIDLFMMTGDQALTATAIAQAVNLGNGAPIEAIESRHVQIADDRTIEELVRRKRVFARVSPADKLRIVQALQQTGKVVAVTGDGINDSPALRAADVGIVMGRGGTDAAREVADIVLGNDDLGGMITALARGRTTYGNIRKAIRFLLATNLSEILVMLTATGLGWGSVLPPIQLLWINLLSDVLPALGLALEPAERGVLDRPPRPRDDPILRPQDFAALGREGATIAAGALAAYGFGLARHGASARASTLSFTSLVGAQLLQALSARSTHRRLFSRERLPPNRPLLLALLGSAALQAAVPATPALRRFLGLAAMDALDVVVSLAGAGAPYLANEAAKAAAPRR